MAKKKKKKKKKGVRLGSIILLLVILIVLALGTRLYLDGKTMLEQARSAKNEFGEIFDAIKAENYEEAQERSETLHGILKELRAKLEGPIWSHCDLIPKYGADFITGCRLMDIADEMMDKYMAEAFELLKAYPLSTLKVDNTFNAAAGIHYLNFAEKVLPDAEAVVEEISHMKISLDKENLIGRYTVKIQDLFDLYHSAEKFVPFLKAMIGDGEDKLYLLAAQNSAEIRAGGGFPGSMGTIRIKDGYLSIGDFTSVWDVLSLVIPDEDLVTYQEWYLFYAWMEYPRDASYDPYFPKVAYIWAESYEDRMGEHIDGVISMSPIIIQKILACTEAITLEDGTVLDGTNATKFIQNDIYMKYLNAEAIYWGMEEGDAISNALFSSIASQTMSKVFSSVNIDNIPKFMKMVEESISDRILMMWLRDSEGQAAIKIIEATGEFNTDPENPQLGVYFSNSNPSKLGWYLDMDINVSEPTVLDNGSLRYSVSVSLYNTIDWGTVYYAGSYIAGETELGYFISYLHLVAPKGGYISGYWMDNWQWMEEDEYMGNQIVFARHFYIGPQEQVVAYFEVTTAPGVTTPLEVVHTPTLQEYR